MSFDLEGPADQSLTPGERIFLDKYLGLDSNETFASPQLQPVVEPQPVAKPVNVAPVIEIARPQPVKIIPEVVIQVAEETVAPEVVAEENPASATTAEPDKSVEIEPEVVAVEPAIIEPEVIPAQSAVAEKTQLEEPAPLSLRDKLRTDPEIQMVSFFIAEQLFLLPVASIQEVVRHMELIKVPQAPAFVAGAINLRGTVLPVVHLSALLTNATEHNYNENKFVIICGTDQMRLGLIIDRISSMHWINQQKIIWNIESRLGDAGDFLYAIANLNDKVCGIVAPETIAQKILSS